MTSQAQVFSVSDPAAPSNDAGFVSATTAPKSLVFKPGAVFPNAGPVQQNVYNTTGLTLLQRVLAGSDLFPAIPLPSSLIELDFSLVGGVFAATTNINFGANASLEGLPNNTVPVQLHMGAFQLSPPVKISKCIVTGTGAGPVFSAAPKYLVLDDGQLFGSALFWTLLAGTGSTVRAKGSSVIGDGIHAVIHMVNASLTIELDDFTLLQDNAITFNAGSDITILCSPNAAQNLPLSLIDAPNVTIQIAPNQGTYTFIPGGAGVFGYVYPQVFDAFTPLANAISNSVSSNPYVINCLFFFQGGGIFPLVEDFTLGNPQFAIRLIGSPDTSNLVQTPTITTSGFALDGSIVYFENLNITVSLAPANLLAQPAPLYSFIDSNLTSADGNLYATYSGASGGILIENGAIGEGTQPVVAVGVGGALTLTLRNATLKAAAISVDPAGTLLIVVEPGSFVDPSYYGMTGVTFSFTQTPSNEVTYVQGGVNALGRFTSFAQLCGYMTAVGKQVPAWNVYVDGGFTGGNPTVLAGVYRFPESLALIGLTDEFNGAPNLTLQDGVRFDGNAEFANFHIRYLNVFGGNTVAGPVITVDATNFNLRVDGHSLLDPSTGDFIRPLNGATVEVFTDDLAIFASSGGVVIHKDNFSFVTIFANGFSDFFPGCLVNDAPHGNPFNLIYSDSVDVDASFLSAPTDFSPSLRSIATNVFYDNSLVLPTFTSAPAQVQAAIDAIKPSVDFPINITLSLVQLKALGATNVATVVFLANPAPAGTRVTQAEINVTQAFAAPGLASATLTIEGSADAAGSGTLVNAGNGLVVSGYGLGTNPYPTRAGQGTQMRMVLTGANFSALTTGSVHARIVTQVSAS